MSNQTVADGGAASMPFSGIGLTPEEETKIRAAAADPNDADFFVDWGNTIRVEGTMLELAIDGRVKLSVNDAGEIAFALTEKGVKYVEEKLLAGTSVAVEVEAPK